MAKRMTFAEQLENLRAEKSAKEAQKAKNEVLQNQSQVQMEIDKLADNDAKRIDQTSEVASSIPEVVDSASKAKTRLVEVKGRAEAGVREVVDPIAATRRKIEEKTILMKRTGPKEASALAKQIDQLEKRLQGYLKPKGDVIEAERVEETEEAHLAERLAGKEAEVALPEESNKVTEISLRKNIGEKDFLNATVRSKKTMSGRRFEPAPGVIKMKGGLRFEPSDSFGGIHVEPKVIESLRPTREKEDFLPKAESFESSKEAVVDNSPKREVVAEIDQPKKAEISVEVLNATKKRLEEQIKRLENDPETKHDEMGLRTLNSLKKKLEDLNAQEKEELVAPEPEIKDETREAESRIEKIGPSLEVASTSSGVRYSATRFGGIRVEPKIVKQLGVSESASEAKLGTEERNEELVESSVEPAYLGEDIKKPWDLLVSYKNHPELGAEIKDVLSGMSETIASMQKWEDFTQKIRGRENGPAKERNLRASEEKIKKIREELQKYQSRFNALAVKCWEIELSEKEPPSSSGSEIETETREIEPTGDLVADVSVEAESELSRLREKQNETQQAILALERLGNKLNIEEREFKNRAEESGGMNEEDEKEYRVLRKNRLTNELNILNLQADLHGLESAIKVAERKSVGSPPAPVGFGADKAKPEPPKIIPVIDRHAPKLDKTIEEPEVEDEVSRDALSEVDRKIDEMKRSILLARKPMRWGVREEGLENVEEFKKNRAIVNDLEERLMSLEAERDALMSKAETPATQESDLELDWAQKTLSNEEVKQTSRDYSKAKNIGKKFGVGVVATTAMGGLGYLGGMAKLHYWARWKAPIKMFEFLMKLTGDPGGMFKKGFDFFDKADPMKLLGKSKKETKE